MAIRQIDITTYPGNIINNTFVPTPTTRHSLTSAPSPWPPPADVALAAAAAHTTFATWSLTSFAERAALLRAYAPAIEAQLPQLTNLLTLEQGKPLALVQMECAKALAWLRAFVGIEVRDESTHPHVDKVGFTGSIATAELVAAACAETLKRVTLELGGNDPVIICEDVDIEAVVPRLATLAFLNSGQICMLVKRFYVHESVYEAFRDAMVERTRFEKVEALYADCENESQTFALAGGVVEDEKDYFITLAIIDNSPDDSWIVIEEPFGPIVPLLKWSDEADVLVRANSGKAGLGASVWSRDVKRAERMARRLRAGSVWVNSHFEVAPDVEYGGHKWSGMGVEGVYGAGEFVGI
ncbi:ALDH-like protein [Mytilinidion resinicola]|uniref:aldehyde dehydrogenase (NAD(+)) n=1 Tax=Mytilinidion resinicola TaxID=574789 RepID=A0A6A6YB71_9PEZI|nr:ALDH-like protein [Mytilinidion resinicola]KAF2805355.1 ALDH-like protein [Mytilinidion resinicola]